MRPEGRIFDETVCDLPEAPSATHIVRQSHRDQHEEREESRADSHLDQLRLIFDVHEEQNNDHSLRRRNRQSHNRIQNAQILKRRGDSNPGEGQKRREDDDVRLWADDMMFGMLRVSYIRRIVIMLSHGLLLTIYGYT